MHVSISVAVGKYAVFLLLLCGHFVLTKPLRLCCHY